jgi:hypothetical protein
VVGDSPGGKTSTRVSPTASRTPRQGQGRRAGHGRPAHRRGGAGCGWPPARLRLHAGVRGLPACRRAFSPDAHAEQLSGNQRRGPRRRGGGVNDTRTHTEHANRFAGEAHGDGEHKDMKGPGATSRHGRPQAPRLSPHPSPERAGAWPQPCLCTRGLAVPARCSTLVTRGAARSEAATHTSVPAQETPARRPVPNVFIARRRRRPRARTAQELPPSRYGSPAARRPALRQGITATRIDVANPTQEGEQGGEGRRVVGWVAHGGAAMELWPARWRGVRRRGRCSRRWSSASAPAPRPQLFHVLLPPARRGVVPGVSTASRRCRCPCSGPAPGSSLARRDAVAARLLLLPSRRKQGRWRIENPKGGLVAWRPCHACLASF